MDRHYPSRYVTSVIRMSRYRGVLTMGRIDGTAAPAPPGSQLRTGLAKKLSVVCLSEEPENSPKYAFRDPKKLKKNLKFVPTPPHWFVDTPWASHTEPPFYRLLSVSAASPFSAPGPQKS